MKKVFILFICLFILTTPVLATIPSEITIQHILRNAGDNTLASGLKSINYSIIRISDNAVLWNETVSSILDNGIASNTLGRTNPLTYNIFENPVKWRISIDGGTNIEYNETPYPTAKIAEFSLNNVPFNNSNFSINMNQMNITNIYYLQANNTLILNNLTVNGYICDNISCYNLTALTINISSNYVPYSGANQSINIGIYNLTTTGNINASYYFGDGRYLTNVGNTSFNQSYTDYLYVPYNSANTSINIGVNNFTTTGIINASYYFGDGRYLTNVGNLSWNESYASTVYVPYNGSNSNINLNNKGITNISFINIPNGYSGNQLNFEGNKERFNLAYSHTATTYTDITTESYTSRGTVTTLIPTNAYNLFLGKNTTFSNVYFDISTAAVGYTTLQIFYSTGATSWSPLTLINDTTNNLTQDGYFSFSIPPTWTNGTVNSQSYYWLCINSTASSSTDATAFVIVPDAEVTTSTTSPYLFKATPNVGDTAYYYIDKNGYTYLRDTTINGALVMAGALSGATTGGFTGAITQSTSSLTSSSRTVGLDLASASASTVTAGSNSPVLRLYGRAWENSSTMLTQVINTQNKSISACDATAQEVIFNTNGTLMYVFGTTNDKICQYTLTTAYDISTIVNTNNLSIVSQDTTMTGAFFKPDGLELFLVGNTGDKVYEFNLSEAWNVTTAINTANFSISTEETAATSIFFKPDGKIMYIMGTSGDDVNQYLLSVPWNISSAVYVNVYSISTQDSASDGLFFSPDGNIMYMSGSTNDRVNMFYVGESWNATRANTRSSYSFSGQETTPTGIAFSNDGYEMYVIGSGSDIIMQYNLTVPYQLSMTAVDTLQQFVSYVQVPNNNVYPIQNSRLTTGFLYGTTTNVLGYNEYWNYLSDGKVGFGTTLPTAELEVVGNVKISEILLGSGNYGKGNLTVDGSIIADEIVPTTTLNIIGDLNISDDLTVADDIVLGGVAKDAWPAEGNMTFNQTLTDELYYDLANDNNTIIELVENNIGNWSNDRSGFANYTNITGTFVPYTGATKSVDLGINNITSNIVFSDTANTSYIASSAGAGAMDIRGDPWYLSGADLEIRNGNDSRLILTGNNIHDNATLQFKDGALERWLLTYDGYLGGLHLINDQLNIDYLQFRLNTNTTDIYTDLVFDSDSYPYSNLYCDNISCYNLTALNANLSTNYVPYTGATQNVNLGNYNLTVGGYVNVSELLTATRYGYDDNYYFSINKTDLADMGGLYDVPLLTFHNANGILPDTIWALNAGLYIQDEVTEAPVIAMLGNNVSSQEYGTITYSPVNEKFTFKPTAAASNNSLELGTITVNTSSGYITYPIFNGTTSDGSNIFLANGAMGIYSTAGDPGLYFVNGVANTSNILSVDSEGALNNFGGINTVRSTVSSYTGLKEAMIVSGAIFSTPNVSENRTAIIIRDGVKTALTGPVTLGVIYSEITQHQTAGGYWNASLHFGLGTNATYPSFATVMTFDGSENVGIGTQTPSSKLNVVGDTNISQDLYVGDDLIVADSITLGGVPKTSWPSSGDNTTFNQSLTDSLYVPYSGATQSVDLNGMNLTNVTNINITGYYYGDGSQLTGVTGGNSTFNQSLTDELYYDLANDNNTVIELVENNIGNWSNDKTEINTTILEGFGRLQQDPTGFPNRTSSSISFDDSTRNFTIQGIGGANYTWYINGKMCTKQIDTINITTNPGATYIYYDDCTSFKTSSSIWGFNGVAQVGIVYWNGSSAIYADERHGIYMDFMTHGYLHYAVGTRYISGLTGSFNNTGYSTSLGTIYDEDLLFNLAAFSNNISVMYRKSANWTWTGNREEYFYNSSGNIYYDNGGVLTPVTSNQYVAYWVFATNSPNYPLVSIMGQRQDTTLANARANNLYESLSFTNIPFQEYKVLYRVILRNDATPYEETQDLRSISNLPSGTYVATSHNTLTGLTNDDHTQYLLADGTRGLTGNWNAGAYNLSANYLTTTSDYICNSTICWSLQDLNSSVSSLTLSQIVTNIGNWSNDKSTLNNLSNSSIISLVSTNIGNWSADKEYYANYTNITTTFIPYIGATQSINLNSVNITNATDINITGYYYGDGSRLTGITSGDNSSFNQTLTDTLYVPYTGSIQDIDIGAQNINTSGYYISEGPIGLWQKDSDFVANGNVWYPFYFEGTDSFATDAWLAFNATSSSYEFGSTSGNAATITIGGDIWAANDIEATNDVNAQSYTQGGTYTLDNNEFMYLDGHDQYVFTNSDVIHNNVNLTVDACIIGTNSCLHNINSTFNQTLTDSLYTTHTALTNNMTLSYNNDSRLESKIVSIGNWSNDKVEFYNVSQNNTIISFVSNNIGNWSNDKANYANYTNITTTFVPYSGATSNVNLSTYNLTVTKVTMNDQVNNTITSNSTCITITGSSGGKLIVC